MRSERELIPRVDDYGDIDEAYRATDNLVVEFYTDPNTIEAIDKSLRIDWWHTPSADLGDKAPGSVWYSQQPEYVKDGPQQLPDRSLVMELAHALRRAKTGTVSSSVPSEVANLPVDVPPSSHPTLLDIE